MGIWCAILQRVYSIKGAGEEGRVSQRAETEERSLAVDARGEEARRRGITAKAVSQ
jgi:hypothetical protein